MMSALILTVTVLMAVTVRLIFWAVTRRPS